MFINVLLNALRFRTPECTNSVSLKDSNTKDLSPVLALSPTHVPLKAKKETSQCTDRHPDAEKGDRDLGTR